MIERTLFFVKPDSDNPYIDKATALEIVSFLEGKLSKTDGNFTRISGMRTRNLPKEFYEEFYSHLKEKFPKELDEMAGDFAGKSIALFIYEGENIIQRVKDIAGPMHYQDNVGKDTIREVFGNKDMGCRTVVHAADRESVGRDFYVLKKWGLI